MWQCTNCTTINNKRNKWCTYCAYRLGRITNRPVDFDDSYDWIDEEIFTRRIWFLDRITNFYISKDGEAVTPQEELFKELFNHEKILVRDMDILTLREHREKLAKIAFEARARLTAVDDEDRERSKKKSDGSPTGFSRNLQEDSISRDAINTIKDRQKRLSKSEKMLEGLKKLGIDSSEAARIMSAGAIVKQLNDSKKLKDTNSNSVSSATSTASTPIFNPFEKKQ